MSTPSSKQKSLKSWTPLAALILILPTTILMGCSAQTVQRNPALTKDCKEVPLTKEHKAPRQRDVIMIERGLSIAECTARMRKLRK